MTILCWYVKQKNNIIKYIFLRPEEAMFKIWKKLVFDQLCSWRSYRTRFYLYKFTFLFLEFINGYQVFSKIFKEWWQIVNHTRKLSAVFVFGSLRLIIASHFSLIGGHAGLPSFTINVRPVHVNWSLKISILGVKFLIQILPMLSEDLPSQICWSLFEKTKVLSRKKFHNSHYLGCFQALSKWNVAILQCYSTIFLQIWYKSKCIACMQSLASGKAWLILTNLLLRSQKSLHNMYKVCCFHFTKSIG